LIGGAEEDRTPEARAATFATLSLSMLFDSLQKVQVKIRSRARDVVNFESDHGVNLNPIWRQSSLSVLEIEKPYSDNRDYYGLAHPVKSLDRFAKRFSEILSRSSYVSTVC
jgi:hypothetical protein